MSQCSVILLTDALSSIDYSYYDGFIHEVAFSCQGNETSILQCRLYSTSYCYGVGYVTCRSKYTVVDCCIIQLSALISTM